MGLQPPQAVGWPVRIAGSCRPGPGHLGIADPASPGTGRPDPPTGLRRHTRARRPREAGSSRPEHQASLGHQGEGIRRPLPHTKLKLPWQQGETPRRMRQHLHQHEHPRQKQHATSQIRQWEAWWWSGSGEERGCDRHLFLGRPGPPPPHAGGWQRLPEGRRRGIGPRGADEVALGSTRGKGKSLSKSPTSFSSMCNL